MNPTLCRALSNAIPDLDIAGSIAAGDVESGGREAGNGCGRLVVCILSAHGGIVDVADKDGFARLDEVSRCSRCWSWEEPYSICNALALGVGGERGSLSTTGGRGGGGPDCGCLGQYWKGSRGGKAYQERWTW